MTREQIQRIKDQYPAGTRIRLNSMDDPQPIPPGTEGEVICVDDAGQLLMKWDNGRSLSLIPGEDSFEIVEQKQTETHEGGQDSMDREWIDFLRMQHPEGSRIKLSETNDPRCPIRPGSVGTLKYIDDTGAFHVKWDDGEEHELVIGADRFKVLPPETHTLKLYMPLTADLIEFNEYGDLDDELMSNLDGSDLVGYQGVILTELIDERMPEESERGIMHWYHDADGVNDKVQSVVFTAEEREGKLWGVAECRIAGELAPEELEKLKDYVTGQASDGWGESFEQHEIKVDDGEMYVHLWDSGHSWSIQTEEERFAPKLAANLPDLCWSVLPGSGELICIKRGESGYYPSDWETGDPVKNRETADLANERHGVTKAQEHAMLTGSMMGWNVPGADPKAYEQNTPQRGGMTLG